jgi:DNA-binding NarL/FixJ family response regulator
MNCVLLADRHQALSDGARGLLGTMFECVFAVSEEGSLLEGAARIQPSLVVVDLSLAEGDMSGLLTSIRQRAPAAKVLLLTVHDEATVATAALTAGADGVVLTRAIATDLLPAVEAILGGRCYRSAAFHVEVRKERPAKPG